MNSLREAVPEYLAMRKSLGFQLHHASVELLNFVRFLDEHGSTPYITVRDVLRWTQQPSSLRPATWAKRLCVVRGFARYRSAFDPRTEIPPRTLLSFRPQRVKPYIYSELELRRLLDAAQQMGGREPLRPWTYFCLFGLLSVTGLRVGEALQLNLEDVDLRSGVLTIRRAKFGGSRLVPLHATTVKVLTEYRLRREQRLAGRASPYFFVSGKGTRLHRGAMYKTFYVLSRQIGLRAPNESHGPRLHDLRYRFAYETLLQGYRTGEEPERRLPLLSTFLGHINFADTYWYLRAWPELMSAAMQRVNRHWGE